MTFLEVAEVVCSVKCELGPHHKNFILPPIPEVRRVHEDETGRFASILRLRLTSLKFQTPGDTMTILGVHVQE